MKGENEEESGPEVDLWGIKFKPGVMRPIRSGQLESTGSWGDVARGWNDSLKRIASGLLGLPADVLDSARKLIRGASEIPGAAAGALEAKALQSAERVEEARQRALTEGLQDPRAVAEVEAAIRALLQKHAVRGLASGAGMRGGRGVVYLVAPEDLPRVPSMVDEAVGHLDRAREEPDVVDGEIIDEARAYNASSFLEAGPIAGGPIGAGPIGGGAISEAVASVGGSAEAEGNPAEGLEGTIDWTQV